MPGALQDLRRLQDEHGFRALVVVFPLLETLQAYTHADGHARIRSLCQEAGLPMLDLLSAFQACAGARTESIAADLFHPNAAGHACAAEAISQHLIEFGFMTMP